MNIAALSSIASTWLEKERDFWSSYLFAFASLWVTVLLLTFWRKDFGRVKIFAIFKGTFFFAHPVRSKAGAARKHITLGDWGNDMRSEEQISPSSCFTGIPAGAFWAVCAMGQGLCEQYT